MENGDNDGASGAARRIKGSSAAAAVVLLGLYLCWLLLSVCRKSCDYTLIHFLFDYRYGVTRRALEGEIARHLYPPPYDGRFFLHLTFVQMAAALSLFLIIAAIAVFQRRSRALILIVFAAATSSLVFKNYLFDQGRQDVFGLLLAEVLMIFGLIGWDGAAQILLGIAIIPLCLIADNQLFLFVPTCLALVAVKWEGEGIAFRKHSWVLFLAAAVALASSFALPPPRLPENEYRRYLQSKTTYAIPNFWIADKLLYSTVKDNVSFTISELRRVESEYIKHIPDFIFAVGVNVLVVCYAASTLRERRLLRRRYIEITCALAVCYLPLYIVGEDYSRWTSNLTTCVYLVAIYAVARFGTSAAAGGGLLVGVVAFQALVQHGFGVGTPIFGELPRLVSFKRDFADCHFYLAVDLARMPGQMPEALAQCEEALRLSPDYAEAHNNLANLLARQPGRRAEAIAHYETALRLSPDYAEAHNNLALLLAGEPGRRAEAIAHYEAALRFRPDYAEAHNNLASLLADDPDRQAEAIAHYEAALRLWPDFAEAHNNLGFLLSSQPGRQADAVAHYKIALRFLPNSAVIHFNLARVLEEMPDRQGEAALHYAAALKIDPDFAPAREALERLQNNDR